MYNRYFGFTESPFSIAPDPRFLYLSEMHQDALAHLDYGLTQEGCIVLLTGEVGTGKTTMCRYFLERLDDSVSTAVIINPKLNGLELLAAVCDEFRIPVDGDRPRTKGYLDRLNTFLLAEHADNRQAILIIDEAQHLDEEVLETVRLLTNLETDERKLLKVYLLGQSNLTTILALPELTQVNQRITGRFHLEALQRREIDAYIRHRIAVAGGGQRRIFTRGAVSVVHRLSDGVPRLVNTICDRSLLGAYAEGRDRVDAAIVKRAGSEIFALDAAPKRIEISARALVTGVATLGAVLLLWAGTTGDLFHLDLDRLLAPADPAEITAERSPAGEESEAGSTPPGPVEADGEPTQGSGELSAARDEEPGSRPGGAGRAESAQTTRAVPSAPAVDDDGQTMRAALAAPPDPEPPAAADRAPAGEAGIEADVETGEANEPKTTRIVIKNIEISQ